MSIKIYENVLNIKLAEILNESFNLDCRAERIHQRMRPDIKCYYNGFRIVIECSYNKKDAENDAINRIKEGLADIAIAIHYKESYPDIEDAKLKNLLKNSKFDAKIITPYGEENILKYIKSSAKKKLKIDERDEWFKDIRVEEIVDLIKHSILYIIEEKEIDEEIKRIKQTINDFIKISNSLGEKTKLGEKISNILYKLYGFGVAESKDSEIIFGQAALAILLSAVFYERLRSLHELTSLREYINKYAPIEGLTKALESLFQINYRPALKLSIEILKNLPPELSASIKNIIDRAFYISEKNYLLTRDFAGRIYHEITGDIAVRKGFATFYTEIPASYLLSNLAIKTVLNINNVKNLSIEDSEKILKRITELKIADFACGSGTLLTAALYNASKIARTICFLYDLDCNGIEKKLIEENIYGLDALRYASQITAINLALMSPEPIIRENINTIYLGYLPNKGAWLGSLELVKSTKDVGGILKWIENGLSDVVEKISIMDSEQGKIEILDYYDVILMNPPFTRATGRTKNKDKTGKKGSLFGFIIDESARKKIIDKYKEIRDYIKNDLILISKELFKKENKNLETLKIIFDEENSKEFNLNEYYSIGYAGEGLLFLYLAYKRIKPDGVIGFVLPKNLLSGVSWFLARNMLANKFHVKYVIVSSDKNNGYNFSENTSLSECLIIAKRKDNHDPEEETIFVNLLSKPKSALEAILLSERILENPKNFEDFYIINRVTRKDLLKNIDNWNRFVFLPEFNLIKIGFNLINNGSLSISELNIPMTRLYELIETMGPHSSIFHQLFEKKDIETPYPVIYGGEEDIRSKMLVSPNAYVEVKNENAIELYKRFSGRILIPDRIRLNTAHVTAMFSDTPLISNVFYSLKLKSKELETEKAFVYWLNTTWGIISILINREETEGAWMRLTTLQWKLLPVPDFSRFNKETIKKLANNFDLLCKKSPRRITEQYSTDIQKIDPIRLEIDLKFLEAIAPNIDLDMAKNQLIEIYKYMKIAFNRWLGEKSS